MKLEAFLQGLKDRLNNWKPYFDRATDPAYFTVASNAGLIFGAHKTLENYGDSPAEIAGISAAAGTLILLLNKYAINPVANDIIKRHHDRRINRKRRTTKWSWYRTISQYVLPLGMIGILNYADEIRDMKSRAESYFTDRFKPKLPEPEMVPWDPKKYAISKKLSEIVEKELKDNPRWDEDGRFYRTFRWERFFKETEERHGIKEDLLAGTAMHESYGDPLLIGPTNDVGLMQITPSAAEHLCNLRIHSDTTTEEMKKLVNKHNGNPAVLSDIDERFDPKKSIDCAAKHLARDYRRYLDWDKATSAYNRGVPARNLKNHPYVDRVKRARNTYREKRGELIARAKRELEKSD